MGDDDDDDDSVVVVLAVVFNMIDGIILDDVALVGIPKIGGTNIPLTHNAF